MTEPEKNQKIAAYRAKLRMELARQYIQAAQASYAAVMQANGRQWHTRKTPSGWEIYEV